MDPPAAGYYQQTQNTGHTYVPGHIVVHDPFLHTDVAGREFPRDWHYPQPSGGLYYGGFTNGAQMNAVWPGSVTVGYNPGGRHSNISVPLTTPFYTATPVMDPPAAGYYQQTQNAGHTYVPGHIVVHDPFLHTDVAGREYPRDWHYPQPSGGLHYGGFTSGAQMNAVWPGSVTVGYNPGGRHSNISVPLTTPFYTATPVMDPPAAGYYQQTQNAGHTYVPGHIVGHDPFLNIDVAEREYPRYWHYPQPSGGLYYGGFTSGAQMNAVWPGSVTVGYNPGGPGAGLTPGVQTPAVGLGQAAAPPAVGLGLNNGGFTSGAQTNAVWPGAVTGGYNPGGPGASLRPGVQTPAVGLGQAAAPPAVGLGLNNGGFTSGAQMNEVWPGSVTVGYNPGGPGASLTPGVQTPAIGLGQAAAPAAVGLGLNNGGFTSGAQINAAWPGAVTGGYNPGEPGASLTPGVQTPAVGLGQAAAPPAVGLGLNNGGFTSGAQMNAVWPGAVTGGYNPGEPGASLTLGVQTPAVGLGQAATPPAVGLGFNNGGFTSGAQMNAVWPGAITGGYNPGEPGAGLTHGVQTPAVGLGQAAAPPAVGLGLNNGGLTSGAQTNAVRPGSVTGVQTPAVGIAPAGSYGVGYSQLSPIATLGFEGQTLQAPTVPEYGTQAAAPPPTLDQQLFPPSLATAANNAFAEDFLLPGVFDNFMDMQEPRF